MAVFQEHCRKDNGSNAHIEYEYGDQSDEYDIKDGDDEDDNHRFAKSIREKAGSSKEQEEQGGSNKGAVLIITIMIMIMIITRFLSDCFQYVAAERPSTTFVLRGLTQILAEVHHHHKS